MKPELVAGALLFRQRGALKHLGSAITLLPVSGM
jgi:hypothetical protein